jgi:hypothetical protein
MVNNSALTALTEGQKKSKCVDQTIFRICAKIAVVWRASRTEIPSHTVLRPQPYTQAKVENTRVGRKWF